jgi:hypothetical protein
VHRTCLASFVWPLWRTSCWSLQTVSGWWTRKCLLELQIVLTVAICPWCIDNPDASTITRSFGFCCVLMLLVCAAEAFVKRFARDSIRHASGVQRAWSHTLQTCWGSCTQAKCWILNGLNDLNEQRHELELLCKARFAFSCESMQHV